MDYSDIYFAISSVSVIAVAILVLICLLYIISILYDIKRLSRIARREAEVIAKGIQSGAALFGSGLSGEANTFVKTLFATLLTHFVSKATKKRSTKAKE
jgi:hypothetical protein